MDIRHDADFAAGKRRLVAHGLDLGRRRLFKHIGEAERRVA
jgi:hypothetical protein